MPAHAPRLRLREWVISAGTLVALMGCGSPPGTPPDQPDRATPPSVWAAGSTEKIERSRRAELPHDGIYDASARTIRLTAVRGEHAPFHLVVTTHGDPLADVRVQAAPLTCDEHVIPARHTQVFYEHQVNVYAPTGTHGRPGYWPDPLVPLTRPFSVPGTGTTDLPRHQPLWVDLFVPRNQHPGVYRGEVSVTAGNAAIGSLRIELTVVDLTLPEKRSFPAHVGYYEHHIARMHGLEVNSDAFRRVFRRYLELLLDHRLDPRTGLGMRGRVEDSTYVLQWPRPDLEQLFLDRDRLRVYVTPVPQGVPRQSGAEPFTDAYARLVSDHVKKVIAHARQRGWYGKLGFWMPVDEPNTAEEYAAARRWGDAVRAVDPEIPVAITEQPFTENPAWGSLVGHVNTWVINGNYLFEGEDRIAARQAAGDRMIWYVSCDQLYPQPNYYIDREAADLRMIPWLTWRYRMSGFLYWTATFWEEVRDPWRDPITWKWFPCNSPAAGEGSLVYPGNFAERYTGQDNVEGPVASLRLTMLREGLEDLELIRLLGEHDRAAADAIVRTICRNVRDFTRDPNVIDQARTAVIRALLQRR